MTWFSSLQEYLNTRIEDRYKIHDYSKIRGPSDTEYKAPFDPTFVSLPNSCHSILSKLYSSHSILIVVP